MEELKKAVSIIYSIGSNAEDMTWALKIVTAFARQVIEGTWPKKKPKDDADNLTLEYSEGYNSAIDTCLAAHLASIPTVEQLTKILGHELYLKFGWRKNMTAKKLAAAILAGLESEK